MIKQTVLCVDDEVDNVEALERLLRPKYEVLTAQSAKEALEVIDQRPANTIATIVSDQRMPQMTGVELFRETLKKVPDCSRILLTGYTDIESIISAVNAGEIFRYITKPWDPVDLVATVDSGVERFNLTQELKNKNIALSAALEDLKSLDRMKTDFMLLIGHELRTPLTSILNFSGLLQDEIKDVEQKKYVGHIQKASARLEKLTGEILFLLELAAGKVTPKKNPIALAEAIEKVLGGFPGEVRTRINLQTISAEKVIVDGDLLAKVLFELIDNAQKFSTAGSKIEISLSRPAPHRLTIHLINQGPAISEKIIQNIESAFLIDKNLLHHSTGRGLGLTTARAILKAHGSDLEIVNQNGQVTVKFTLPDL